MSSKLLRKLLSYVAKQRGVSIRFPGVSLDPATLSSRAIEKLAEEDVRRGIFPSATFDYPAHAAIVTHVVDCRGTISAVAEGQQVWLAVMPEGGYLLHPNRGPVHIHGDLWSGVAYVGSRVKGAASDQTFEIRLVLISDTTAYEWQSYLDEAHRTGGWTGIPADHVHLLASRTVIRNDARAVRGT